MNNIFSEAWNSHLNSYVDVETWLLGGEGSWLQSLRQQALRNFVSLGFPNAKEENWKYTRVHGLANTEFTSIGVPSDPVSVEDYQRYFFTEMPCSRLVFVNGHFVAEASEIEILPEGAVIGNLANVFKQQERQLRDVLARYADYQQQPFTALNTAFIADGAYFYLPRKITLTKPIHLLFITNSQNKAVVTHPRNLIVLEPESELNIIEHYIGLNEATYFTNAVTEVVMREGAKIEHIKLQEESAKSFHIATIQVQQGRDTEFLSRNLALGAQLARNDINSVLVGEGAKCTLEGLYVLEGNRHVDNHTRVDHKYPHTSSRERYKGILGDKSRAVFNGKVMVYPGAQKVDAQQANRNLLLSEGAEVNTKPELEIYADDVKCAHGATVGQLDNNHIFYLRSRGLDEDAARQLLIYAFAEEMVKDIDPIPVRTHIERRLNTQFFRGHHQEIVL
ncbi:FeS assembly protein SufD [Candidatus Nitrosoglobus terrae]|uniref:FeS assembly protein SufD n=1 Tax=Candidatus Nitrosoglobus terrae TaxID=1630141 RepID=A0A1Q2SP22_9GAMM|nr:Fe-S cluster assembly protein SufD [Candidatus Nitrosoglobus terrae]BAW80876.1 FeS assembly protein SufD [Candidatus Nitrosoglobus terrae]